MNLLVLMYHRARAGRLGNSPEMLELHLSYVARSYATVLPGDALATDRLNVCLSFDDGYFDFYDVVFPLLRKHGLRALLAVPPMYVKEQATAAREARRTIPSVEAFAQPDRGGFCTWSELEEMVESQHVGIAAHGFSHQRLDQPGVNFGAEIVQPQSIFRARTGRTVDAFVFPFGRYSDAALWQTRQCYRHVFRIGGAMNRNWNERVLYRVDADQMENATALFSSARLLGYRTRYWWNRLRLR